MLGYIGNTDHDWYEFLLGHGPWEEVNFWQPSGGRGFHAIAPGAPFFFRVKSPYNAIAGFGFFVRHSILPAWLAWESFTTANGAPDFATMRRRIEKYRRTGPDPRADYNIGCLMVAQPTFFAPADWVREPKDWQPNVVQGKTINLTSGEGSRIFEECRARASGVWDQPGQRIAEEAPADVRFGDPALVRPRLGQGTFRIAVMDAYGRACAVTGERSLPVLEAAHVRPYSDGGEHAVTNGLFMRADIHKLYDLGYVTVTPEHEFAVSRRLRDEYENGRVYYQLDLSLIHI